MKKFLEEYGYLVVIAVVSFTLSAIVSACLTYMTIRMH